MKRFLKSIFFVWFPVGIVVTLIHHAAWGDIDTSSFYAGGIGVLVAQFLDEIFGYNP